MLGITVCRERYERWWLGKYCRPANRPNQPFKKVIHIDMVGPPSFVYGQITFHYQDGTEDIVAGGHTGQGSRGWAIGEAYKPRKVDVEAKE